MAQMSHFCAGEAEQASQISNWLLALLRFAVSLQESDKIAFLATARLLDGGKPQFDAPTFSFFSRTSAELCAAIVSRDDPGSHAILRSYLGRIEDPHLRRVLEAAIGLQSDQLRRTPSGRDNLWTGLEPAKCRQN
jgi:hypothetical protein